MEIKPVPKRERGNIRIQITARLPVPYGYELSPDVVRELLSGWIEGEDLPYGAVTSVEWDFENGKRVGREDAEPGKEVDGNGSLRDAFIRRFAALGSTKAAKKVGPRIL